MNTPINAVYHRCILINVKKFSRNDFKKWNHLKKEIDLDIDLPAGDPYFVVRADNKTLSIIQDTFGMDLVCRA